jgi:hypothetical protein
MKILIAYSSKSKYLSTAQYFVNAAAKLNLDYKEITENDYSSGKIKRKAFDEKIIKFKPSILIFIEGGDHRFFPLELFNLNVLKISYLIDTHLKDQEHIYLSHIFDVNFLAQRKYLSKYAFKNAHWLPLAAVSCEINFERARNIDICFIGSMDASVHPERIRIMSKLKSDFKNVKIGEFPANRIKELYSNSKVVVNWSVNNDLNMRVFEGISCGAHIISNSIEKTELKECGIDGYITIVNNYHELKNAIENYLQDYQDKQIKVFPSNISYDDRLKTILKFCNSPQQAVTSSALIAANFAIGNYRNVLELLSKKSSYRSFGVKSNLLIFAIRFASFIFYNVYRRLIS